MRDELLARIRGIRHQSQRIKHRRIRRLRRWIERTNNLVHLSVLLFVPLLIVLIMVVSEVVPTLALLLFPPLVSGAYTLFADPESQYASPRRFVGGLTIGALCGWAALEASTIYPGTPQSALTVHAIGASLGILLTGIVTWLLDLEEPSAFSTAVLVLLTGNSRLTYVLAIAVSSSLIAGTFLVWHDYFYERRAQYLYESTTGDDRILVPVRGETYERTAWFAAELAAAHDASKVVLLETVEEAPSTPSNEGPLVSAEAQSNVIAAQLEEFAAEIETETSVPCQVVVAVEEPPLANLVLRVTKETGCDLIVTPYEAEEHTLSPFIRQLFQNEIDVVVHRSTQETLTWERLLVMIDRPGDLAHSMLDFAQRLAGTTGHISVCKCIAQHTQRREAERMLTALVDSFTGQTFETRISLLPVEKYLTMNGSYYDLVIIGASTDRSKASRILSPPTFEQVREIDTDVAVVHEGLT